MEKKWLTLNQHGKFCLKNFVYAISGTDLLDSQVGYLLNKDLIDYKNRFKDITVINREYVAGYGLTNLGRETVMHYFKNFGLK